MTKAYWSTSTGKTIRLNKRNWENIWQESAWWKLQIKKLENRGNHSSKFSVGLIGEKEGKKWLIEQGYDVCEFGMMEYYFKELEDTINGLKRRRKQKYIEEDTIYVNALEHKLKGVFSEKFEEMRKFFCEFFETKKMIKNEKGRTRSYGKYIGGFGPDFIVKKNNDFSFVEVKANQSTLSNPQRACFKIADRHGFKAFVLRVKVESNISKDFCLVES